MEERILKGVFEDEHGLPRMYYASRKRVEVRLPVEVVSALDKEAETLGSTRSDLIEAALIDFLQSRGYETTEERA